MLFLGFIDSRMSVSDKQQPVYSVYDRLLLKTHKADHFNALIVPTYWLVLLIGFMIQFLLKNLGIL